MILRISAFLLAFGPMMVFAAEGDDESSMLSLIVDNDMGAVFV